MLRLFNGLNKPNAAGLAWNLLENVGYIFLTIIKYKHGSNEVLPLKDKGITTCGGLRTGGASEASAPAFI